MMAHLLQPTTAYNYSQAPVIGRHCNHPSPCVIDVTGNRLAFVACGETFTTGGTDASVLCRAHALGTVIWKPLGLGPLCERFGTASRRSGVVTRRVAGVKPVATGTDKR